MPCLRFIDPYSDVVFNDDQLAAIEKEMKVLKKVKRFPAFLKSLEEVIAYRDSKKNKSGELARVHILAD